MTKAPLTILLAGRAASAPAWTAPSDRRAGARQIRRAGLCAPRDRPQPLRGRDACKAKGAIFVEELDEIPDDRRAGDLLGPRRAQGGARRGAAPRNLLYLDATCPLVTKVHREAERHFAARPRDPADRPRRPSGGGRHAWASCRRAPCMLVETVEDVARASAARPADELAYVTQTTLSVDDTRRDRRRAAARASRASSARTRKTSATPPPTARRR